MQTLWFFVLLSSICLEGLGRKYLPGVPSIFFYFFKDLVLIFGYLRSPPPLEVRKTALYLYRGFGVIWVAAFGWTVIEMFNPSQGSFLLALIGLRAYWLWWLAPFVMAALLQKQRERRRAIYVLVAMTAGISILAAAQFASPPDSSLNLYSVVDGQEVHADSTVVAATGRARVASTFSFITGFGDFTILVPTLLLSLGLETREPRLRRLALGATVIAAAVVPMSGSRSSIVLGVVVLAITSWTAGFFFTRVGRRIIIGTIVTVIAALAAFPDAFIGVQSRFADTEETNTRVENGAVVLPPVALYTFDYPMMGIGTGMQQNARISLHIDTEYETEPEVGRYLIELGPIGFLMVWTAKLGLIVALIRCYSMLKKAGRRGAAGAALSYAVLTMNGHLTYDHIFQALYFLGCGIILAEVVSLRAEQAAYAQAVQLRSQAALATASG